VPNVKIFVEQALFDQRRAVIADALLPIRDLLCSGLKVDVPACQFAVMPCIAMPDLPLVNIEMHILPKPERTRAAVLSVCHALRILVESVVGCHVAIRVMSLDPETYIALK